jgi:2-polyprenyl-6-methoxyphenol hydroxylase-like FAD-dependent oxidoreductase
VLARSLDATDDPADAFHRYERARHERTARIQLTSRQNTWGKTAVDPGWVYGYDVWQAPLAPAATTAPSPVR